MSPIDVIAAICAAVAVVSIVYWVLSDVWLHAFFRESVEAQETIDPPADELPAITFFRPLKTGVVDLGAKLESFAQEIRASDQILFGVERGSKEMLLCEQIVRTFPSKDLAVIECDRDATLNPKIAKLLQMTSAARHEHWMVLDSEFVAEPGWLERFRAGWKSSDKDAFTAGYRFTGIHTFLQTLDAMPTLLTLWPGLATVVQSGKLNFMLGAVIALRRQNIEAIGGWRLFSEDLAEDNRLGVELTKVGKAVGLSRMVATLTSDPMRWRDYWRHQRRVAVTYRVCNPAGFAGMICTYGVPSAFALVLLKPWSIVTWIVFGATLGCRWWTARRFSALLRFPVLRLWIATIVASFVEMVCWFGAWFSTTVWWAGRRWRVRRNGKLLADGDTRPRHQEAASLPPRT